MVFPAVGQKSGGTMIITIIDSDSKVGCTSCIIKIDGFQELFRTDSIGKCIIEGLPENKYNLILKSNLDSLQLHDIIVTNGKKTFLDNIELLTYCNYDPSSTNICPLCKKNDKTLQIFFGKQSFSSRNQRRKFQKAFFICSDNSLKCKPHWYCKRDKYKY